MKKIFAFFAILAPIIFLASCSDNSTGPSTSGSSYLMNTVGNYWIYDNYELDSLNQRVESSKVTDSTVISAIAKDDFNGTQVDVAQYDDYENGSLTSSSYMFEKDGVIYEKFDNSMISGFDMLGINIADSLNIKWMPIADSKNSTWTIIPKYSMTMNNINFQGVNANLSLSFEAKGAKGTTKSFTVNGSSVTADEYIETVTISMVITPTSFPIPITIPINMNVHFYVAKGIGLISTKTESTKLDIAGMGSQLMNGNESVLIRYNAK